MPNEFRQLEYTGYIALDEAIADDDVSLLRELIVAAALYEEDFERVSGACVTLSGHSDEIVRGNAVLSLGHIARLFGRSVDSAKEIVENALRDTSEYVRGQAHAARSDLRHFLGMEFSPLPDDFVKLNDDEEH